MSEPYRVVLTGGPGGGKTTLLEELRADPRFEGRLWFVPESATQLILMGFRPGSRAFQESVLHLQFAFERAVEIASSARRLTVCDRGILDSLAYWKLLGEPEPEFFRHVELDYESCLGRYRGVIHLETTALGAEEYYARCSSRRPEPIEEAIRIDRMLGEIWGRHPHYDRIENGSGGWEAKLRAALRAVEEMAAGIGG